MLSLLNYETTVGCQFRFRAALMLIFVVTYGALTSSNEECFQGKASELVTCKSNWSIRANIILTGNLRCESISAKCRFKLSTKSSPVAILSDTACPYSVVRVIGNLTHVMNCSLSSLNISFTVSISGVLDPVDVIIFVDALDVRKNVMLLVANVSSCSSNTNSGVIVSTSTPSPGFKDTGTFQCTQHPGQVFYENATRAISTSCNAHAEWEDIDKVHCHYSPTVTFVEQRLSNGSEFNVLNICNVSAGYPRESTATLNVVNRYGTTKQIQNGTFITPDHHGLKAYCFTRNDFGNDTDNSTLNVTFAPRNSVPHFPCGEFEGSSRYFVRFSINFTANPAQGSLQIAGLESGVVLSNVCEITNIDINCRAILDNVADDDIIVVKYQQNVYGSTMLGAWNIMEQCLGASYPTTVSAIRSSSSIQLTESTAGIGNAGTKASVLLGEIVAIATIGGILLVVSVVVAFAVITFVRGKSSVI